MFILSVVIPHHNTPDLLKRCLNSIPESEEIQIIIVDDNSSSEIVDFDNFPGRNRKNVDIVFSKEGKGAGYARNIGLKRVKGKFTIFADSDDFFTEGAWEYISSYYNKEFDVVYFKAKSVISETLQPSNRNMGINNTIDLYFKSKKTEKEVALDCPVPWCKLLKTDFILNNNICFDEIRYANDVMFATKVACLAEYIIVSNQEIYTVTLRSGSLSYDHKKDGENFLQRLDVFIRQNKYLIEHKQKGRFLLEYYFRSFKISSEVRKECLKKLKDNGMLFSGLGEYIKYQIKSKILKQ